MLPVLLPLGPALGCPPTPFLGPGPVCPPTGPAALGFSNAAGLLRKLPERLEGVVEKEGDRLAS